MNTQHKATIEQYIEAYNQFDIEGMIQHLHEDIIFENITNDQVDLRTEGIPSFRQQVETAKTYFKTRTQKVSEWNFQDEQVIIDIHYEGVLGLDLPNGLEEGDTLELEGKSEFTFKEDKISSIRFRS